MDRSASPRRSYITPVVLGVCVVLLAVVLLGLNGTYTEVWEGGYPRVACDFTFVDSSGNPVEGVTLQVERPSGGVSHHRPIDDFYPGRVPTSDSSGVMQLHCCGHDFGGTCHTYFHFIHTGTCGAPEYVCRFLYHGTPVYSVSFNQLAFPDNEGQLPRIKRSLAIPTAEQIFGDSIPPVSELTTTDYEFMQVRRTITVQP